MPMSDPSSFAELLKRASGAVLPRQLEILVHLSECDTALSPGACMAMCLQYPVLAKAQTPEEAIKKLLADLLGYLKYCETEQCFAPSWAERVYRIAFDYGDRMDVPEVEARVSQELAAHLGIGKDLAFSGIVELRDIRKMQQVADERSIEDLFSEAA